MKLLGVDPFYMRYFAKADLTIIGEDIRLYTNPAI